jgi:hypothetical protein
MGSKGKEKRKAPQDKHKSLPMPELDMGDGPVQKTRKEAK